MFVRVIVAFIVAIVAYHLAGTQGEGAELIFSTKRDGFKKPPNRRSLFSVVAIYTHNEK